jgi:lysophospholipase L1-like esterase
MLLAATLLSRFVGKKSKNRAVAPRTTRDVKMPLTLAGGRREGARVARLLGMTILAALLVGLVACSQVTDRGSHGMRKDTRQETVHREKITAWERTAIPDAPEKRSTGETEATTVTDASVSWDYVALGDSLAVGTGARRGYVDRFASHIRTDTGTRVNVVNLGQSGQTSSQLLHALRSDNSMRRTLGEAEVITFNIGINDLGHAGESYRNGTCGGDNNEECLRTAVETFEENWDALIAELLSLRSTDDTIVRTAGIGYTPRVDEAFEPYVVAVNRHVATTAANNDVPYAQPYLGEEHISPDGVHPNDNGYEIIADQLRKLGYSPLG